MSHRGGKAPFHPSMALRSLVFWIGDRNGKLLEHVDRLVVGTIAMSLAHADRNLKTIREARRRGFAVALDGEAWRNQLEPGHPKRGAAFAALGFRLTSRRLDPDAARFTSRQQRWLARRYLAAQIRREATLLLTPGHFSETPTGVARLNDLGLARCCRSILDELRRSDARLVETALYATIVIPANRLTSEAVRWLINAYREIPVDGFWISVVNFNESGKRFALVEDLVLGLQAQTGKPAVVAGLGPLWQAALRNGAAAACAGPQRGKLDLLPPRPEPRNDDADSDDGRRSPIYLGAVLGAFAPTERGRKLESAALRTFGCRCKHHDPREVPRAEAQRRLHNTWWYMLEARRATRGTAFAATLRLAGRVTRAAANRVALGMAPLRPGWRRAATTRRRQGQAPGRAA